LEDMPPKVGQLSTKGRGRGRGKAMAKGKAKGKAKAAATKVIPEGELLGNDEECALAIIPKAKAKAKASGLHKKIMDTLGEKSMDEVMADAKAGLQSAEAMVTEATGFEDAQGKNADCALKEYENAREAISQAIEEERVAAEQYRDKGKELERARHQVDESRRQLLDAQKRVAFVEVMQANQMRMKELEEKRKAAQEAAENAKRVFLAQKQAEKDALEAGRRALEEARTQKGLSKGRGVKRPPPAEECPGAPADSVDPN